MKPKPLRLPAPNWVNRRYNMGGYGRPASKKSAFWKPKPIDVIRVAVWQTATERCGFCKNLARYQIVKSRYRKDSLTEWTFSLCLGCSKEWSLLHEIELPPDPFGKPDPFSPSEAKRERV